MESGKGKMSPGKKIRLDVKVQPRARSQGIQQIGEGEYRVRVLSPPTEGKANKEVVVLLASHFRLPPSRVKIVKGLKSRQKVVVLEY